MVQSIHYDPRFKLQKEDVFGYDDNGNQVKPGMVVAESEEKCPVWGDMLPYKSVTVICNQDEMGDVEHWLMYVHGGPASRSRRLEDGRIAVRSDYQAW